MDTHQSTLNPRQQFAQELERIEGLPQMQRWREIKNLLFKIKPELKPIDADFCAAIRQGRDFNMLKDTGASKSGSTRRLYSMPQYMYAAITLMDPEFLTLSEDKDANKALHRKIARAFPEYRLAKKI